MLKYEEFASYFEGMSTKEIEQAIEFIKLWLDAPPKTRQAIDEYLSALDKCDTIGEALNYITDEGIREKLYNQAVEMGILNNPTTKDKAKAKHPQKEVSGND